MMDRGLITRHAHECPRTDDQWRDIYLEDGTWFLCDHEYSDEPIIACPYCGVRLTLPADQEGVSAEGAASGTDQCTCRVIDGKHDPHCPGGGYGAMEGRNDIR
jgi:hypothetical protein